VGVELVVTGFMAVSEMLMMNVDVVDVVDGVVFGVVGFDGVVVPDTADDARYQRQHITTSDENQPVCRSLTSGGCSWRISSSCCCGSGGCG